MTTLINPMDSYVKELMSRIQKLETVIDDLNEINFAQDAEIENLKRDKLALFRTIHRYQIHEAELRLRQDRLDKHEAELRLQQEKLEKQETELRQKQEVELRHEQDTRLKKKADSIYLKSKL